MKTAFMKMFQDFLNPPRVEPLCLHEAVWREDVASVRRFLEAKQDPSGLFKDVHNGSQLGSRLESHKKVWKFNSYLDKSPLYLGGILLLLPSKIPLPPDEKLLAVMTMALLGSYPYYKGVTVSTPYSEMVPDQETLAHWPPLFIAALRNTLHGSTGNTRIIIEITKLLIDAGADVTYEYKDYNVFKIAQKLGLTEFHETISNYWLLSCKKLAHNTALNVLISQNQVVRKDKTIKEKFLMLMPELKGHQCTYKKSKKHIWLYFSSIEKCQEFCEKFNTILDGSGISISAKALHTKYGHCIVRINDVTSANLISLALYQDKLKLIPVSDIKQSHLKKAKTAKRNEVDLRPSSPLLFSPSAPKLADGLLLDHKEQSVIPNLSQTSGAMFTESAKLAERRVIEKSSNQEPNNSFG